MSAPLVSVVIPVYNAESHIDSVIADVLAQTYRPLEVVIVDDGSTDGTAEIARRYEGIRYYRQDNAGPSAARNAGVALAAGEFIAFLDSDDLWTADKLERQMQLFAEHPELGVVICDSEMRRIRPDGTRVFSLFQSKGMDRGFFGSDWEVVGAAGKLLRDNFITTPSLVARTSLLLRFPFNTARRHVEDLELWLKLAINARLGYVPEVCVTVLDHGDGLSSQQREMLAASIEVFEAFVAEHGDRLDIPPDDLRRLARERMLWSGYGLVRLGDVSAARACYRRALRWGFDFRIVFHYLMSWLPQKGAPVN